MSKLKLIPLAMAFMLMLFSARGQGVSSYSLTSGVDPTKWIPLTSSAVSFQFYDDGGTLLTDRWDWDDASSQVVPIGFSFTFGGQVYTSFSVNTNDRVRLGTTPCSYYYSLPFISSNLTGSENDLPLLCAHGMDNTLGGDSALYVKYELVGTAPNRTLVIEYRTHTTYDDSDPSIFNYQIHLCEGTDMVRYVYGRADAGYYDSYQIGMATSATDVITVDPTLNMVFVGASSSSTTMRPANGKFYEFTPSSGTSCGAPLNLQVSNIRHNKAFVSWNAVPNAQAYILSWVASNDTHIMHYTSLDDTVTISPLVGSLNYRLVVQAVCSNGDTGFAALVSFSTPCRAIETDSLPWRENFDRYTTGSSANLGCLTKGYVSMNRISHTQTVSHTSYPYPQNSGNNTGRSAPNGLYMYTYSYYTNTNYSYLCLPPFEEPVNHLEVSFAYKRTSTSVGYGWVSVGVMTNPSDPSTFVEVASFQNTLNNIWDTKSVSLASYHGNGEYITFRCYVRDSTNSISGYTMLDDIEVNLLPACPAVANLRLTQSSTSAMEVQWDEVPGADTAVSWTVTLIDQSDNSFQTYTAYQPRYIFTNLTIGTAYSVVVQANCDASTSPTDTLIVSCVGAGESTVTNWGTLTTTTTAYYIPLSNFYNYTITQQMYTPDEVSSGAAATLTGISFQYNYAQPTTSKNNCSIYLAQTTQTNLASAFVPASQFQLVYVGPLNMQQGWNRFEFTSPFNFSGTQNLVVMVHDNSGSYNGSAYNFNMHGATSMSRYAQNDGSAYTFANMPSGSVYSYRCNTKFTFCASSNSSSSSCTYPMLTLSSTDTTEAVIDITPGGAESEWIIAIRQDGTTAWTTIDTTTNLSYILSNLAPGTLYHVRGGTDCGTEVLWSQDLQFRTDCGLDTLPYRVNFNVGTYTFANPVKEHLCWTFSKNFATTAEPILMTPTGATSKALKLPIGWTMSLPLFARPVSDLQVQFKYVDADTTRPELYVGVMSDPTDYTSFVPFDTISLQTSMMSETFIVPFDSYQGMDGHISFRSMNTHAYLDDINVMIIPNCIPTYNLQDSIVTTTSAIITWDDSSSFSQMYELEYGPIGFTPGTGTVISVPATSSHSYATINGLTHSTMYSAYVRTICVGNDTSLYSQMLEFTTDCDVSRVPYVQSFDSSYTPQVLTTGKMPPCWKTSMIYNTTSTTYIPQISYNTTYAYSGGFSLRMYGYAVVAMPELNTPIDSLKVSFSFHTQNDPTNALIVGVVDSAVGNFASQFIPIDTVYNRIPSATTRVNHTVYLTGYHGSARHIAFRNLKVQQWNNVQYAYAYIDNVHVSKVTECVPVRDVKNINMGTTTALFRIVDWDTPTNSYEIEYGPKGFAHGASTATTVTAQADTVLLSNLQPGAQYDIYVRTVCSASNKSAWSPAKRFMTQCNYIALPYQQDFESTTANTDTLPRCWRLVTEDYYASSASSRPKVYNNSSYASSGSKSLYLYYRSMVALPPVSQRVDTLLLTMNVRYTNQYSRLIVGYITNVTDTAAETFVPLDTLDYIDDQYHPYELYFPTDSVSNFNFAFRNIYYNSSSPTSSSSTAPMYIDDIRIECLPSCFKPVNLHITQEGATTVGIGLSTLTATQGFVVEYGPRGINPGQGTIVYSQSQPIVLTGLTPNTLYSCYVRAICSPGDTSARSSRFDFRSFICDDAGSVYVGNPSSTTQSPYVFTGTTFYNHSTAEMILDTSLLTGLVPGLPISAMDIYHQDLNSRQYFSKCTIYMANTQLSQFPSSARTSWVTVDNSWTRVFAGNLNNWESVGAQRIYFDSAFSWDGHSSIIIAVDRDTTAYSTAAEFKTTETPGRIMSLCFYSDGTDVDPRDASTLANANLSYYNGFANVQFVACGMGGCQPPRDVSETHTFEQVTASWSGTADSFEVAIRRLQDASFSRDTVVTTNSITYTGLFAQTQYVLRVRSLCDENESSQYIELGFTTDSLPCMPPATPTVSSIDFNSAVVDWQPVGTESIWNVRVWNTTYDDTIETTSHPVTVSGLQSGITYNVAVAAVCGAAREVSDFSPEVQFTTSVCDSVLNVAVSNITSSSATVTWTPGANNSGSWTVEYGMFGFAHGEGTILNVTSPSATLTGLLDDTRYEVVVSALCQGDNTSVSSTPVAFRTTELGIEGAESNANVSIYPNPTSTSTTITLSGMNGTVTVSIVDLNGRTLHEESMQCTGNCETTLNVDRLAKGVYIVRVASESASTVKRLVVK